MPSPPALPPMSRVQALARADETVSQAVLACPMLRVPGTMLNVIDALRSALTAQLADGLLAENSRDPEGPWSLTRRAMWRMRERFRAPVRRGPAPRTDVLLVARYANHVTCLVPLAEALEGSDLRTTFAVFTERDERALSAAGFAVTRGPAQREAIESERHRLRLLFQVSGLPRQLLRGGLSAQQATTIADVVRARVGEVARVATFARRIVAESAPRAMYLGNPHTFDGAVFVAMARANGVPSFAVQHGDISPHDPNWRHRRANGTWVWGTRSARVLQSLGRSPREIVVGAPRAAPPLGDAGQTRDEVLVVLSGAGHMVGHAEHARDVGRVREATRLSPRRFNIRLHPKDSRALYTLDGPLGENVRLTGAADEAFTAALARARVVLTAISTTGIEAMQAGVPVLTLGAPTRPPPHFAEQDTTLHVTGEASSVHAGIERLFVDDGASPYVERGRAYTAQYWASLSPEETAATIRSQLSERASEAGDA